MNKEYKHIINKRFLFRFKNDNLQISLTADNQLPIRYVYRNEEYNNCCEGEIIKYVDKEDLEIWRLSTQNIHQNHHNKWYNVLEIINIIPLQLQKEIFSVILDNFQKIFNDDNLKDIYFEIYKNILLKLIKQKYVSDIKQYINEQHIYHNAILIIGKNTKKLLQNELNELKYFNPIINNITEYNKKTSNFDYSYHIDIENFDMKLERIFRHY